MTAKRPRWSRRTARSDGACSPRCNAGTSRRKIPAAMRLPTRRPGFSRGSPPRRRSRELPPVTLLALLKHPLMRLGPRDRHAVAALERAILRGPRPRAGSAGLAQALASFRAQLGKFRRHEPVDLHPSDPRVGLTEDELAGAADLVARLGDALAPLERRGGAALPLSELAGRHRDVVAALSRQDGAEIAFAGPDGANSPTRSTNSPRAKPPPVCSSRHPTMSNYFPRRFRAASCAGRPGRVCACASSGCSKRA